MDYNTNNQMTEPQGKKTEAGAYDPSAEAVIVRERIKQKPVNKRKLLRRTMITVVMAAVFGMVACLTFMILQPVINGWLNPEEEPVQVAFPEETEEVLPEDMYVDDTQMFVEATDQMLAETNEEIQSMISNLDVQFGVEEYLSLYEEIKNIASENAKMMVTVTGVTSDIDWFNNTYENEKQVYGAIVANNGKSLIVLVQNSQFDSAESILVTFFDGAVVESELLGIDSVTDLAIIAVPLVKVQETTMDQIKLAKLGSSNGFALRGTPVMAFGNVAGVKDSIAYGIVTSTDNHLNKVDSDYKLLTTDIYGSSNATGILTTYDGIVVGVIDMRYNNNDASNLISALGISDLKRMIEKISNGMERAYLGVYGMDISEELQNSQSIPAGIYVNAIDMDSPAMNAGIQSGDIIVNVNDTDITHYRELITILSAAKPGQVMKIKLLRQSVDAYAEVELEITLGQLAE